MNSLILISHDRGYGFQPILSGKNGIKIGCSIAFHPPN
jgi:hypothetical protein